MTKKYSVLMSVYQKENPVNLQQAMDSIWNQSVPTDDFVLVCDGPLNKELDSVIEEMKENHFNELTVVRLAKNGGLGKALNIGLQYCKHDIVARMDSDDISLNERCEKQLNILLNCRNIDICSGTVVEFIGSTDNIVGKRVLPEKSDEIYKYAKKRNPFNHPAVMLRKTKVECVGGYDERYHLFEDYYLWMRMLKNGSQGFNIKEPLLYMRTQEDFYLRRGGYSYAKDMLRFHKWLVSENVSSWLDFATGAVPHAVVCVMPNQIRRRVYKMLHK